LKSGIFNLLEPSGPVQTCNGIALPFYIHKVKKNVELQGTGKTIPALAMKTYGEEEVQLQI